MYYKITNKESEICKKLYEFRSNEIEINKRNKQKVEEKVPGYSKMFGVTSQQTFHRTWQYEGFVFANPENLCGKTWVQHKEHSEVFVPNSRTKLGKEMSKYLKGLECSSVFSLMDILDPEDKFNPGIFTIPFLEIKGDTLLLYLDDKFNPTDENFIEITRKEFESYE